MPKEIVLGEGTFAVNGTVIGLTRGGGQFVVERTYKEVAADGDMGPVKDRIRKDRSVPRLTIRALELLASNLPSFYPATNLDTGTANEEKLEGKEEIEATDYQDTVSFVGKTDTGKAVTITLANAINLNNIDWALIDKDEVVSELIFTGTYLEADRQAEPWDINYVTTP